MVHPDVTINDAPNVYHVYLHLPCIYISAINMCWTLNSHCFHKIGDDHQLNSRVYIPNSRVYIPNSRVCKPNSRVYIPNTRVYIPNSRVCIPNSGVCIPILRILY